MMIQNEQFRNCTVSFRTTSAHKIQLNKLAEASSMPTSEYLLHLTNLHPHVIDKMSGETIKEQQLREEVRKLQRRVTKLETDLENADLRIEIEQSALTQKNQTISKLELELKQKDAEIQGLQITSNRMKEIHRSQLSIGNKIPEKNQEVAEKKKLETDEYVLAGLGLAGVLAIAFKAVLKR
jgi:DNA repair exonuclease SbcCD ATPase subunit